MAKKKTLKKPVFSIENMKMLKLKPGLRFEKVDCKSIFRNTRAVHEALLDSFAEGDIECFKDVLRAYLKTVNKAALIRTTKLSRTTLFRMVEPDSNPTLENVAEIMRVLKAG